jgi:TPR repeat protein
MKKALEGRAYAQNCLGEFYGDEGLCAKYGIPLDFEKSYSWLQKAADQGYALSWQHLGYAYCRGIGVKIDFLRGAECYKNAAGPQLNCLYMYLFQFPFIFIIN